MGVQLLESLLYIITVTATSLITALLLYKGIKQSTDFLSGSSNRLLSDTFKVTFRLSGAVVGFIALLFLWLNFVPYDKAVPSTEVWQLSGRIDAPQGVGNDDIRIAILPLPSARRDMTYSIHLIREKDSASQQWQFPVILFESSVNPPKFETTTINLNDDSTFGLSKLARKDVRLQPTRE